MISPSLNFETVALPSWMFRFFATRCASFGLALPENTIRLSKAIVSRSAQTSTNLAGEEGFEPSNAGIKIRCLNQLGDSPTVPLLHAQGVTREPPGNEPLHRRGKHPDHALGLRAVREAREDAT